VQNVKSTTQKARFFKMVQIIKGKNTMPTKQEINDYMNESHTHTIYTAHLHFNIEITQVYKILES
jgi:hypothetical protein